MTWFTSTLGYAFKKYSWGGLFCFVLFLTTRNKIVLQKQYSSSKAVFFNHLPYAAVADSGVAGVSQATRLWNLHKWARPRVCAGIPMSGNPGIACSWRNRNTVRPAQSSRFLFFSWKWYFMRQAVAVLKWGESWHTFNQTVSGTHTRESENTDNISLNKQYFSCLFFSLSSRA